MKKNEKCNGMVFTGEKCPKCGGAVALQHQLDFEYEDEFVCVNCGRLWWEEKDEEDKPQGGMDILFIRGELVGPQNHSGIVQAIGGAKHKSNSSKKRKKKKWNRWNKREERRREVSGASR